jgi:hypothetical protein
MKVWQRRTLGIMTLGGGAIGIAAALMLLFTRDNPLEWLLCLAFIALYGWGIWCGAKVLEGLDGAERSSLVYWLVQIPSFSSPLIGYFFSSGFHTTFSLQFSPLNAKFNFLLGSTFNYSLMQKEQSLSIGINIFALFIAWWLAREVRRSAP